jgi:hypothetical protein
LAGVEVVRACPADPAKGEVVEVEEVLQPAFREAEAEVVEEAEEAAHQPTFPEAAAAVVVVAAAVEAHQYCR